MKRLIALAAMMAVGACTTPDTRPLPENAELTWQQHRQSLSHVGSWQLSGRMALQAGDEGGQANLHWRHSGQGDEVRITGAWGKGLILLEFQDGQARLVDDRGVEHMGTHAETLLYRVTGWYIPVDYLRYWLLGLPGEESEERFQVNASGLLDSASQDGWSIRFPEYRTFDNWRLPRTLRLSRKSEHTGQPAVSVRLVVDRWQVDS